jgi:hypothetical protein
MVRVGALKLKRRPTRSFVARRYDLSWAKDVPEPVDGSGKGKLGRSQAGDEVAPPAAPGAPHGRRAQTVGRYLEPPSAESAVGIAMVKRGFGMEDAEVRE